MDLNKVMIIGRLTRDPELRSLPSGKSVATMGVATGRAWTDANGQKQKQTEFHNVVMWGKLGEIASQYLHKGSKLYVEGRLQTRDWNAQDGSKRSRTEVVAENMIMLDARAAGTSVSSGGFEPASAPSEAAPAEVIEEEVRVEDIPF
jgi:single-strand DNA-binding protein